jgi:hypothetical protein
MKIMSPASAGHQHHSLSPVPEHSGTGQGYLIPVSDWYRRRYFCSFQYQTDRMPDSPAFRHLKKEINKPYTSILAKDWNTPCTFSLLAVKGDTPCTSILLAVEGDTPCSSIVHTDGGGNGYTLQVHSAGC